MEGAVHRVYIFFGGSELKISREKLGETVKKCLEKGISIIISGHGAIQSIKEAVENAGFKFTYFDATSFDLMNLPQLEEQLLPREERGVLFFDNFHKAHPEVKKMLSLVKIPSGWIAIFRGREEEMPIALITRCSTIKLEGLS